MKKYIKEVKKGLAALIAAVMVMGIAPVGVLADMGGSATTGPKQSVTNVIEVRKDFFGDNQRWLAYDEALDRFLQAIGIENHATFKGAADYFTSVKAPSDAHYPDVDSNEAHWIPNTLYIVQPNTTYKQESIIRCEMYSDVFTTHPPQYTFEPNDPEYSEGYTDTPFWYDFSIELTEPGFYMFVTTDGGVENIAIIVQEGTPTQQPTPTEIQEPVTLTLQPTPEPVPVAPTPQPVLIAPVQVPVSNVLPELSAKQHTPFNKLDPAWFPVGSVQTVDYANALNVRRGAGTSHPAFNHLLRGAAVTVLAYRSGWVEVETSRGKGWISAMYLRRP